MNILVDTHIALWALYDSNRLTPTAVQYLTDNENTIYCSLASVWEVEIKNSIGKLDVISTEFIKDAEDLGFRILPISRSHIFGLSKIERKANHKDPFDRLLLSQAIVEQYKFLTMDEKIRQYSLDCIL